MQFAAYYAKKGSIVAVARFVIRLRQAEVELIVRFHSMQKDPLVSKASELLRLGLMPSASEIKGGKVGVQRVPAGLCDRLIDARAGYTHHRHLDGQREAESCLGATVAESGVSAFGKEGLAVSD